MFRHVLVDRDCTRQRHSLRLLGAGCLLSVSEPASCAC
jgi:hypothetical protein